MKIFKAKTIAVVSAATIVVSIMALTSCEGRRMSNMKPTGETVDVVVNDTPEVDGLEVPGTAVDTLRVQDTAATL